MATVLLNYAVTVTRQHAKMDDAQGAIGQVMTSIDLPLIKTLDRWVP
jgi:hypothetical protein